MNEIEKMYENAGIEKRRYCFTECKYIYCNFCDDCSVADKMVYPPFTAEKQIELIKYISHHDGCFEVHLNSVEFGDSGFGCRSTFEESLAVAVSMYLSSATEKEKQQIKEILE